MGDVVVEWDHRPGWSGPAVAGSAAIGLAVWTALAMWLNAFFVDDVVKTFYDPQGYEQERDALLRGATALSTAGVHVGHGLAVFVGVALGLRQTSVRATLAATAGAGLVLAAGQGAVAAMLTVPWLEWWDERGGGGDHSFPTTTFFGDQAVLVPVLVCLVLYPLLAMLGGRVGLHRNRAGWPPRRTRVAAVGWWSYAGPFYLLSMDLGPARGEGWGLVVMCWLAALSCLVLMLTKLSDASRRHAATDGQVSPARNPQ